jgi:hypothetical protein
MNNECSEAKENIMSLKLLPFLRLLLLQSVLTVLIAIPFQAANAGLEVTTVSEHINTYLYEGESLNLVEEMELESVIDSGDKIVSLKIKAQAIEEDANLKVIINDKVVLKNALTDNLKEIKFKVKETIYLKTIKILSEGAFIRIAKADVVSDEPQDDDLSQVANQMNNRQGGSIFSRVLGMIRN